MKNLLILSILVMSANILLSQNVERYKIHHNTARKLILEGNYNLAISELDKAIDIMPYYASMYQDRAYAYMQLKQYNKALIDIDYVLREKPYLTEIKLQKAMAFFHLKKIKIAELLLIEIINNSTEKNSEAEIYLSAINEEYDLRANNSQRLRINILREKVEYERIKRARHRESVIMGTVLPLVLWSSLFLSW